MKKIWTLLVAAITVLAVLTSGCGGSSDKAAKPADGKKTTTIGFSISTLNNPFFVSVRKGVEEEAKNSESMLKSSMRKTTRLNRLMIFLT